MDFETLLAQLINPGDEGPSPSIYDDLSASYTDATSTRDAKIGDQESLISQLTEELTRTKLMNYELMISQVAEPEASGENENDETPESDPDDIGDDDDFFADEDKD